MESNSSEPIYSIGLASRKLGVSPETLRYYEKEGLLIAYRTDTGRRLYSHSDLEWIKCFRNQMIHNKLNVAGVRLLLALMPCWDIKPCSQEERKDCAAYLNSEVVCWMIKSPASQACKQDECRDCKVYKSACQAGKLNKMYIATMEMEG